MYQQDETFFVGKAVTSLQTMLRTIAVCHGEIPTVIPDGIYGPATGEAVRAFQKLEGLPATGVTDFATWKAIRQAFAAAQVEMAPSAPLEPGFLPNQVITPDSDNLHVLLIQAMLHILHEIYGNMTDCGMTGIWDGETVQAVKCLQKTCGMQETGIFTKGLWQMLASLYCQAVGDGDRKTHCGSSSAEK